VRKEFVTMGEILGFALNIKQGNESRSKMKRGKRREKLYF